MTVYEKIDRILKQYEQYKYHERSLDSLADYIDWAWKWRRITEKEKDEVCDRICKLFEQELTL